MEDGVGYFTGRNKKGGLGERRTRKKIQGEKATIKAHFFYEARKSNAVEVSYFLNESAK